MQLRTIFTAITTLSISATALVINVNIPNTSENQITLNTHTLACSKGRYGIYCGAEAFLDESTCSNYCRCAPAESADDLPGLICKPAAGCTEEDVATYCIAQASCQCASATQTITYDCDH